MYHQWRRSCSTNEQDDYALYLILYHQWRRLLCAKNSYKETAELSMKTAADEVRNLVVGKKNNTVNEDDSATNENANIDADDSQSDENSIIADNEFIADTVVSSDG